jgi:hypothetical protein
MEHQTHVRVSQKIVQKLDGTNKVAAILVGRPPVVSTET